MGPGSQGPPRATPDFWGQKELSSAPSDQPSPPTAFLRGQAPAKPGGLYLQTTFCVWYHWPYLSGVKDILLCTLL